MNNEIVKTKNDFIVMKTPKERAQELYDMFSDFADIEEEWGYVHIKHTPKLIKDACKFACDEVINSWKPNAMPDAPVIQFYEEVKKEIDLL